MTRRALAGTGPGRLTGTWLTGTWIVTWLAVVAAGGPVGRLLATTTVVGALAGRAWLRHRRNTRINATRAGLLTGMQMLATDLAVGCAPSRALIAAAEVAPVLEPVASAAARGDDLAQVWHRAAREPGAEALLSLAVSWQVAHDAGAPLARPVRTVVESMRAQGALRAQADAAVAGSRVTARILAGLPVVPIVWAEGSGGNALGYLTTTASGTVLLAGGVGLIGCGLAWTAALERRCLR